MIQDELLNLSGPKILNLCCLITSKRSYWPILVKHLGEPFIKPCHCMPTNWYLKPTRLPRRCQSAPSPPHGSSAFVRCSESSKPTRRSKPNGNKAWRISRLAASRRVTLRNQARPGGSARRFATACRFCCVTCLQKLPVSTTEV